MDMKFSSFWKGVIRVILLTTNVHSLIPDISKSYLYTATSDLVKLIDTEAKLVDLLHNYIEEEETNLERLKAMAAQVKRNDHIYLEDGSTKLVNPIDTFLTIKRIYSWNVEEEHVKNRSRDVSTMLDELHSKPEEIVGTLLPTEEDLNGAADALFRLQDTYNLKANYMADGKLLDTLHTESLTAAECFQLGRIAFKKLNDSYHGLIWFQESLKRLEKEKPQSANKREVLEYLSGALYDQGNIQHALFFTRQILQIDPDYKPAKDTVNILEEYLMERGINPALVAKKESNLPPLVNTRLDDGRLDNREIYEALCRGERQDETEWPGLYCYYKRDTAYSKLAPFKIEIARLRDPQVLILRNIVTDGEIEMLKALAEPQFFTTANFLKYRVSKSAWVADHEDALVNSFSRRIEQATGLSMESAEALHLSCYGIGGHYEPHFDYFRVQIADDNETFAHSINSGIRNRIATVLPYLSQPYLGGATVFTELRLTLYPSKNDAAFWFNLHRNGSVNPMTRHAACPVLAGTKWIANKWVHEKGQEFRYKCARTNG